MTQTEIQPDIRSGQERLAQHPVFSSIHTLDDLRLFMSWHVFAVWDFMCLVKRLQRDLTSTDELWLPPREPLAARLVNDIVLAEESDVLPDGSHASHFEIYLMAMQEVGADTRGIRSFIARLEAGVPVAAALQQVSVPPAIATFVNQTLQTVSTGTTSEVLGSFFYGRENIIPLMFQRLLDSWQLDVTAAPMFVYYLQRHIELDGDEHGPAATRMIRQLTRDDQAALRRLNTAARAAIDARIRLWDELAGVLADASTQCQSMPDASGHCAQAD